MRHELSNITCCYNAFQPRVRDSMQNNKTKSLRFKGKFVIKVIKISLFLQRKTCTMHVIKFFYFYYKRISIKKIIIYQYLIL